MFETVRDKVFPFNKSIGGNGDGEDDSTYSHNMKDALFMMPTPRVPANAVGQLDNIEMAYSDARRRFTESTFHGYDFGSTMLRIGSMNMLLHGVQKPDTRCRDSLTQADQDDAEKYSLVQANSPFAGSLDYESTARDLKRIVKTKKTERFFWRFSFVCSRSAAVLRSFCPTGCCSAHPGRTRPCTKSWWKSRSSTR
jgi:hypothetical protein